MAASTIIKGKSDSTGYALLSVPTLGSDQTYTLPVTGGTFPMAPTGVGAANLKLFTNAAASANEWALGIKYLTTTYDTATATGTVAYTGVGFKPSVIFCMAVVNSTQQYSWGVASADSTGLGIGSQGAAAGGQQCQNLFIYLFQTSATIYTNATLQSFDTDGFTVSYTKTGAKSGSAQLMFLCFR